ncbi:thioesterase II family protein [Salinisphaera hydrothermalis]|uniref:thioesterase II family protein n=1 Tax=Salinisphaera hydrothermalis TaxID=563188 RepID=UPI00333E7D29
MINDWVFAHKERPEAEVRLLCFPYGGAGASIYKGWERFLPETIELCAIQLPGRENRMSEGLIYDADLITERLWNEAPQWLFDKPVAIFGHSMGAVLGYYLTCRLQATEPVNEVRRLFISAAKTPLQVARKDPLLTLSDDQFLKQVQELSDAAAPGARIQGWADCVRLLRNDFTLCENAVQQHSAPLSVPMTVLYSEDDLLVSPDECERWSLFSKHPTNTFAVSGSHLFLKKTPSLIVKIISSQLGL